MPWFIEVKRLNLENVDLQTKLKRIWYSKIFRWIGWLLIFVVVDIWVWHKVLLGVILPTQGMFDNGCPSSIPEAVERTAYFKFPPSATHIESFCMGMQGWFASANFEMSPEELETFINSTYIEMPLDTALPTEPYFFDPDSVKDMKSYLYSNGYNGLQEVLIDTSDPDKYFVYFRAGGG